MPAHRLNDVPFALYLITHSYFHLYHLAASVGLRQLWRKIAHFSTFTQYLIVSTVRLT